MSFMLAFGWASVMLCIGVFLRARIPVLRNMLVPASAIAGVIGCIFMNAMTQTGMDLGMDANIYTDIVNNLFTVSFISITLTVTPQSENGHSKDMWKGIIGMGIVWCFLYALTPIIGMCIVSAVGGSLDSIYGMLIQFAFCQGPGQAASYGTIFEQFGWDHSAMVAITFSAIGFVAAFLFGIPAARLGVQKGLAKHCGKIDDAILKGYLKKDEQTQLMVKDTTCSSNIETLTYHFAVIGVCYILAVGISKILALLPGFLGTSMGGMMFMNGMYAAYIVKLLMKGFHLDFLMENTLQSKITGWTADYLVVCAFMAVSVRVIRKWIVPILVVCIVVAVVTFFVCCYFGQRFGGTNDFERTLGLYGTCTGTVPSGIAIVRIVDPDFKTTTSIELGACNLVMMASTPVYLIILAYASGTLNKWNTIVGLMFCCICYLVILKLTKTWGKKTFDWK